MAVAVVVNNFNFLQGKTPIIIFSRAMTRLGSKGRTLQETWQNWPEMADEHSSAFTPVGAAGTTPYVFALLYLDQTIIGKGRRGKE